MLGCQFWADNCLSRVINIQQKCCSIFQNCCSSYSIVMFAYSRGGCPLVGPCLTGMPTLRGLPLEARHTAALQHAAAVSMCRCRFVYQAQLQVTVASSIVIKPKWHITCPSQAVHLQAGIITSSCQKKIHSVYFGRVSGPSFRRIRNSL